jgi:hypothetical protein
MKIAWIGARDSRIYQCFSLFHESVCRSSESRRLIWHRKALLSRMDLRRHKLDTESSGTRDHCGFGTENDTMTVIDSGTYVDSHSECCEALRPSTGLSSMEV